MKVSETYTSCLHVHVRFHIYSPTVVLRNKGVVQIHHGLGEHADLYESLATFLVSKGFVVVVSDTVGHGRSLIDFEQGYFGKNTKVSDFLVEDMKHLFEVIRARYEDIPYFLLGFGFGSTLVRKFISVYGDRIDGALLISPAHRVSDAFVRKSYLFFLNAIYGPLHKSKGYLELLNKLRNRRLSIAENNMSWLISDDKERRAFLNDPMTSFVYTVKGSRDIIQMVEEVNSDNVYKNTPSHLVMYIATGDGDPLLYHPEEIVNKYRDQGLYVTYHHFENKRHALLLEADKQKVFYDIYNWLNDVVFM